MTRRTQAQGFGLRKIGAWLGGWDEAKARRVLSVTLAVLTGLLLGLVLDTLFRKTGNFIFPPPPTFDMASAEDKLALLETVAADYYVIKLAGWVIGTFGGAYLAVRMALTGQYPAWVTGILLYAAFLIHMTLVPHPLWVIALSVPLCIASIWLAAQAGHQVSLRRLCKRGPI